MTLKEICVFLKAVQKQEKDKRANIYLHASMVASFVGNVFNGQPIPPIYEVLPEDFNYMKQEADNRATMLQKEQWLDFAMRHNAKRAKNQEVRIIDNRTT